MNPHLLPIRKPAPRRLRWVTHALLGLAWSWPTWAMTSAGTSVLKGWHLQLAGMNCKVDRACNRPTANGTALTLFWSCNATERANHPREAQWQLFWNGGMAPGILTLLDPEGRQRRLDFDLDGLPDRMNTPARLQLKMDGALISRTLNPLKYGNC